jgi:DNA-binding transcriptional LysR family regulator
MHLRWDDLQTVEALVRTGTVLGAARELELRHTSVSRRVDALEKTLGAPLFLRGPRLRPTPLALRIAERATRMATEATHIGALVEHERRERAEELSITTNDVLASLLFSALARADLGRSVSVHVTDVERELAPGVTDLALRPGAQPSGSLRGWRLGRLLVGVYRARRARDAWLYPAPALRERASMRWWRAVPARPAGGLQCDSLLAMRDACVAGLGRAVLPAVLARGDARLQLVDELDEGPPLWLLASATRRSDAALQASATQLMSALRAEPGVFGGR